jgi:hypothetical protein
MNQTTSKFDGPVGRVSHQVMIGHSGRRALFAMILLVPCAVLMFVYTRGMNPGGRWLRRYPCQSRAGAIFNLSTSDR